MTGHAGCPIHQGLHEAAWGARRAPGRSRGDQPPSTSRPDRGFRRHVHRRAVQPSAEEQRQLKARRDLPPHQRGAGRRCLGDDRGMEADEWARHAGAELERARCLRDRADRRPDEWAFALLVEPRVKVVGDDAVPEPGLFRACSIRNELFRPELFRGERVPDLDHAVDLPGLRGDETRQPARLPTMLIMSATITAPKRYESRACWIASRRIGFTVRSVSETWKVIPTVRAR